MNGVLQSIKHILNSGQSTITREQVFNDLFAQANKSKQFVINPETIVTRQNNPELNQVLHNTQAFAQRQLSQQVDRGAYELDQLLGRVGITSNLSETLKYPTTHYVLEPGVYYKRQHKLPTNQVRPTPKSPGVIQEFIGFKDTPMMDWDVAGPYHAEKNATIRHLGDVEDRIQNYLSQNPETTLRLYQSPGGYRAFDLTNRQSPIEYNPSFELLDVDPDYRVISQQKPDVLKYQGSIAVNDTERFNSRINPKVGRVDWVAQPIAEIAGANATVDPTSIRRVQQYHDEPIQQNFLKGAAQTAGFNKLKENLPTASQFLQKQIQSYLGL
jgi:hypothetical protein